MFHLEKYKKDKKTTMGATCGTGSAYPAGEPKILVFRKKFSYWQSE